MSHSWGLGIFQDQRLSMDLMARAAGRSVGRCWCVDLLLREEGGQEGHVQNPSAPPGTYSKYPELWVTMGWKVRVWPAVWTPSL